MNTKLIRWTVVIVLFALAGGIVTFTLRGPYMSNYLKKIILRELSSATGKEVLARDIRVSFFPLFVVVDGIRVIDEKGQRIATIERAKAYVGLSGLLRKEVEIAPIYLRDVEIGVDRASIKDISDKVKNYIERKSKKKAFLKVKVKSIEIENTHFAFSDEEMGINLSLGDSNAVIRFRDVPYVEFSLPKIHISYKDLPEFDGSGEGSFFIKKDTIELKTLSLKAYGSEFGASGGYSTLKNRGSFTTEVSLLVESVKEFFGLKKSGRGKITAKGLIEIDGADIGNPMLSLSLKGDFMLESLMELLKAKTESELSGYVSFKGDLNGKVNDLRGRASARLRNGKLFDIPIDDLRCNVIYGGGRLEFKDAKGILWGGTAGAEAYISIPGVKPYSLDIEARGISSPPLLALIGLDSVGLPLGKVDGAIHTEGDEFDPSGWFRYESLEAGETLIGRIKAIDGAFEKTSNEVSLYDIHAETGHSEAVFSAIMNTISKEIKASGDISTTDIRDITEPYFGRLSGEGHMRFSLGGLINAPVVNTLIEAEGLAIDSYRMGSLRADASYKEGIIELDASSEDTFEGLRVTHSIKGKILLEHPLDIKNPEYALSVGIKNSDMESLLKTLGIGLNLRGRVFSDIEIKGKEPSISGTLTIARPVVYGFPLDAISGGFSYRLGKFSLSDGVAKRGDSSLNLSGVYSKDGFSLKAGSDRIYLRDVFSGLRLPSPDIDYKVRLSVEGRGRIEEPEIDIVANLTEGRVGGIKSEDGRLEASLRGKEISLNAALFNDLVSIKGSAKLSEDIPWRADIGLSRGRYDFLLRSFLKGIPPDALIGLEGSAHLEGSKGRLSGEADLSRLYIALYEQEFATDKDIKITISDKKVSLGNIFMRGKDASFKVSGGFEFHKNLDIALEGRASLLPLGVLSKDIEVIKGKGDFVLSAKGSWDRPTITGGIEIIDATIGIKGFAQRLTNISGYLYIDEDTITVERLSAKSRGGEIETSGAVYLKGFGIERVYLETLINQVSVELQKGLNVVFGGNLVLKGTPEGLDLTGDININRATYKERIEWRTWLVSPKKKESVQATGGYLDKVRLNLRVHGSDAITIDNNIARASLKTDLIVRGTLARPMLYGRIEAKEGKVYFRNNEFTILTATADFSGTRAGPYYVIVAETFSRGYHIWLTLEGEIEKFDLTLHSDPPLDDVSILALLTVGEFGERLSGLEGGIGAAEAASFLTGKYQDVVEERVRNITGFDRVQIDPYVSKSTGSVVPKVTVSKKLIGDRLYVTYSSAIGTAEEQVLKLEYLLSSNVSLVGVRDERGSIGGDIKLRFRFK